MAQIATFGYGLAGLLFLLLSGMLVTSWRGRLQGGLLVAATVITTIWAGALALQSHSRNLPEDIIWSLEILRDEIWILFLLRLLENRAEAGSPYARLLGIVRLSSLLFTALLLFSVHQDQLNIQPAGLITAPGEFRLTGLLLLAVLGLLLVEQLFRNTPPEGRWGIKYLCLGLGLPFVYDFYFYADALLFNRLNPELWAARGGVNLVAVPLIAVSAARNPKWSLPVFMSRQMVFHTTTLFAAGVYMLLMALAGYYLKTYGGDWGAILQIVFLFGAIAVLIVLLFSGQWRARMMVFLNKHFFSYQYDYREEWLRLIGLLSGKDTDKPLSERVIWALGEIVDSPGGLLWMEGDDGRFRFLARYNQPEAAYPVLAADDPLLEFIRQTGWIVKLDELVTHPEMYQELEMPPWLEMVRSPWLIAPLMLSGKPVGLLVLERSRAPREINWENMDLLKTAGQQAASYLVLNQAAQDLADARQFEGFNRLSAFVMHDLKNLIAQLSLVARNAAKHKHNPEFVDDAIVTVENAVNKMNRLMQQLQEQAAEVDLADVDLVKLIQDLIANRSGSRPQIEPFESELTAAVVRAEPDRMASVIGHVMQNAQDATPADGWVRVRLLSRGDQFIVEVEDNGCGMDEEFIRARLFRPFDSTKGLTGMGIGAYEAREFVTAIGGQIAVQSTPGQGTRFQIFLPRSGPALAKTEGSSRKGHE